MFSSLTTAHKNVIRSMQKLKYLVAKKQFRELRKPYDVKDVMEQYSQGHINMMQKIKAIVEMFLRQYVFKPFDLRIFREEWIVQLENLELSSGKDKIDR